MPTNRFPPDAVRVWRGFRISTLTVEDFGNRLGSVFMPATVELQVAIGLNVYAPTVTAGLDGKPDAVPDETAIVFWDSRDVYDAAFKTLAARSYTLLHSVVFTPESHAHFPVPFGGELVSGQPAYLATSQADWMHGTIHHLVGSRPNNTTAEAFVAQIAAALRDAPSRPEHAIVCAANDYLTYWELQASDDTAPVSAIDALSACIEWNQTFEAKPTTLGGALWDDWEGIAVAPGQSFNYQFKRRWEK